MIQLKRAYEPPSPEDGYRLLVDRRWPRGIKKEALALDDWAKEIAPSTQLRQWFGHDPAKWPEFCTRYTAALKEQPALLKALSERSTHGTLTLVFAAKDIHHNNAVVLKSVLEEFIRQSVAG